MATLLAFLAGLVGVGTWMLLGRFSTRRIAQQPVDVAVEAEQRLLQAAETDPGAWLICHTYLTAKHFTAGERRTRWTETTARWTRDVDVDGLLSQVDNPDDLSLKDIDHLVVAARRDATERHHQVTAAELETIIEDFSQIASSHTTREWISGGRFDFEATDDPQVPFRRPQQPISPTWRALSGLATAIAAVALLDDWPAALIVFAYLGLGAVIAHVDHATFYVDMPVFYWWAGACLAGAGILAATGTALGVVGAGIVTGLVIGGVFEGLSWTMGKLTGRRQGGGDTLLVFVTASVAAIIGDGPTAGILSVAIGGATALIEWVYLRIKHDAGRDTPIAFGPHLILGATIAAAISIF